MNWESLYFRCDDSAQTAGYLLGALVDQGYQRYDPFPGGMGTPPGLKTFVKHFVAPANDGWVRILGTPDAAILPTLSAHGDLIYAYLSDQACDLKLYAQGAPDPDGLSRYLKPGKTLGDLARARLHSVPTNSTTPTTQTADLLPDDIQQLARDRNVNPDQANKLVNRLTSQLFGKMDRASGGEASAMQSQARALIDASGGVNWNDLTALRLAAMVDCLTLPANWRDPDFDTLRAAYQVARRLARTPSAQLMPDEKAALKAFPDALQYETVYMGK